MKRKDLLTVITVALGTATLTVASLWSGSMDAGNEGEGKAPQILQPKLVAGRAEVTLALAPGWKPAAGQEPVFELTAFNPGKTQACATVRVAMTGSSVADALSRVARAAGPLWRQDQPLTLGPNERKVITLRSNKKLPPNSMISVSLQEVSGETNSVAGAPAGSLIGGKPARLAPSSIVALSFSTFVSNPTALAGSPLGLTNSATLHL